MRANALLPSGEGLNSPALTLGGVMAIAGPALALSNLCPFFEPCPVNPTRDALFSAGLGIGVTGDIILTAGTVLFGVAAHRESHAAEIESAP
jgi:hypothetical protein